MLHTPVSLHRVPPEVGLVKSSPEVCSRGLNSMCQPYIESTALSDIMYIYIGIFVDQKYFSD